jgi:hypothetical protein
VHDGKETLAGDARGGRRDLAAPRESGSGDVSALKPSLKSTKAARLPMLAGSLRSRLCEASSSWRDLQWQIESASSPSWLCDTTSCFSLASEPIAPGRVVSVL